MRLFGVTNFDQFKAKVALFDTAAGAVLKVGESEILLAGRKVSNLTMDNIKFGNNEQNLVINGRMDERRIRSPTARSPSTIIWDRTTGLCRQ